MLHCTVCGDVVEQKDLRSHLENHNPNAANFSTEEVLASFKNWPNEPLTCPSCGEPLDRVAYNDYLTYVFDPETNRYKVDDKAGDAEVKCINCGYDLTEEQEFSEGPANYPAKPAKGVTKHE